jgi:acyl carrier protein
VLPAAVRFEHHTERRALAPFGRVSTERLDFDPIRSTAPVDLAVVERGGVMTAVCQFRSEWFSETTIHRWLLCFEQLLERIIAAPASSVAALRVSVEAALGPFALGRAVDAPRDDRVLPPTRPSPGASPEGEPLAKPFGGSAPRPVTQGGRPPTAVEEVVARIWCELLGLDTVGLDDDYFELGGQSLPMLRMVARLTAAFGVTVPLGVVFTAPTVAALARHIEGLRGTHEPGGGVVSSKREA